MILFFLDILLTVIWLFQFLNIYCKNTFKKFKCLFSTVFKVCIIIYHFFKKFSPKSYYYIQYVVFSLKKRNFKIKLGKF